MQELATLRGEKNLKSCPQNWILIPLRSSLQNFRRTPPYRSFYMGVVAPAVR